MKDKNTRLMDTNETLIPLSDAVEAIKTAIMQGQYEALKDVNRVQLAVYFAIGKYLSKNTRKGLLRTGAIEAISEQLHKELPGLRGFSVTQMYEMRKFYEEWIALDSETSSVATEEIQKPNNEKFRRQRICPNTYAKYYQMSRI